MIEVVVQNSALLARRLSFSDLHPIILGGDLIRQDKNEGFGSQARVRRTTCPEFQVAAGLAGDVRHS
jgi:hypothetical protein